MDDLRRRLPDRHLQSKESAAIETLKRPEPAFTPKGDQPLRLPQLSNHRTDAGCAQPTKIVLYKKGESE